MTTTPSDKELPLPDYDIGEARNCVPWRNPQRIEGGRMTTADLAAILSALDPETRARVLEPYLTEARRVALVGKVEEPCPVAFVWRNKGYDGPGWYYYTVECQDDVSVGAFMTLAEAVLHAQEGNYTFASIDSPENPELSAARELASLQRHSEEREHYRQKYLEQQSELGELREKVKAWEPVVRRTRIVSDEIAEADVRGFGHNITSLERSIASVFEAIPANLRPDERKGS